MLKLVKPMDLGVTRLHMFEQLLSNDECPYTIMWKDPKAGDNSQVDDDDNDLHATIPEFPRQVCEESRSIYQAFLSAARKQSDNDQVFGGVTRVLVVGRLSSRVNTHVEETAFMKHLCCCNMTTKITDDDEPGVGVWGSEPLAVDDINKEWKHPSLPLYIHASRGLGDKEQLEQISSFLAERNSTWSFSSWLAVELGKDCRNWKRNLNNHASSSSGASSSTRVHVVWLLYSVVSESTQSEWACLKAILQKNEIPVQIVIVSTEKDKESPGTRGEHLWTDFLNKRGGGSMFPNVPGALSQQAELFITVPSDCLSNDNNEISEPEEEEEEEGKQDEDLPQQQMIHDHRHLQIQSQEEAYCSRRSFQRSFRNKLDHKALWASAEGIKTIANIQQTAQIIHAISLTLSKRGAITVTRTNFMTLYGRYSLERATVFTLKCLCKTWEIPTKLETAMLRKLVSWELHEASSEDHHHSKNQPVSAVKSLPRSSSNSITLRDHGRYLPFSIRLAHVIVYCKALHLMKGWIDINVDEFSLELDDFYAAHGKFQFDREFAKSSSSHFAIQLSQIQQTVLSGLQCTSSSSDRMSGFKPQLQNSLEKFLLHHVH